MTVTLYSSGLFSGIPTPFKKTLSDDDNMIKHEYLIADRIGSNAAWDQSYCEVYTSDKAKYPILAYIRICEGVSDMLFFPTCWDLLDFLAKYSSWWSKMEIAKGAKRIEMQILEDECS